MVDVSVPRILLLLGCIAGVVLWVFVSEEGGSCGSARHPALVDNSQVDATRPPPNPIGAEPVGAGPSTREPTENDRKEANEIYWAQRNLLKRSKEMDKLRQSRDPQDLEQCVELMDELLPKAKTLFDRTADLPVAFIDLSAAANHMTRCVTCNHDVGRFNCVEASKLLKKIADRKR